MGDANKLRLRKKVKGVPKTVYGQKAADFTVLIFYSSLLLVHRLLFTDAYKRKSEASRDTGLKSTIQFGRVYMETVEENVPTESTNLFRKVQLIAYSKEIKI